MKWVELQSRHALADFLTLDLYAAAVTNDSPDGLTGGCSAPCLPDGMLERHVGGEWRSRNRR
jgi:hypothetical protein